MKTLLEAEIERLGITWKDLGTEIGASETAVDSLRRGRKPYPLRALRVARAIGWTKDPMMLFEKIGDRAVKQKQKGYRSMAEAKRTLDEIIERQRKETDEGIARAFMPLINDTGLNPREVLGDAAPEERPSEHMMAAQNELARLEAAKDEAIRAYEEYKPSQCDLTGDELFEVRQGLIAEMGRPRHDEGENGAFSIALKERERKALEAKRDGDRAELRAKAVEASRAHAAAEKAMAAINQSRAMQCASAKQERTRKEEETKRAILGIKDPRMRCKLIAENMDLFAGQ